MQDKTMNAGMTILLFLCLIRHCLVGGTVNYDSDELLAILLDLHSLHCGEAAMCHMTNSNHIEPTVDMWPKPCCVPCSCLSTCEAHQNCCPSRLNFRMVSEVSHPPNSGKHTDITTETYQLDNMFNTSTEPQQRDGREMNGITVSQYNNRNHSESRRLPVGKWSDATRALQKSTLPTTTTEVYRKEISNFKSDNNDNGLEINAVISGLEIACLRPQLLYKPNAHPDSDAYEMVISCPVEFQDAMIAEKCRIGQSHENIADIIPMTSTLSGLTYVNKYCLFCNEREQQSTPSVDEWQIQIIWKRKEYFHIVFLRPQSLMSTINNHFFNVHFLPKNPTVTHKCKLYDVTTCNQTGFWENYDKTIEMICRVGEDLPVIHAVNGNRLLFKNIACVHCNVPSGFNDSHLDCGYLVKAASTSSRQTLTVNFYSFGGVQTSDKEDISVTYIETSVLRHLKPGSCPKSSIAFLGRCRRTVCPREHYEEMGRCVPLYNILTGLDINFKLKITPVQGIQGKIVNEVAEKLQLRVNTMLENVVGLQPREVLVWFLPKSNGKTVSYYLFDIYVYSASNKVKYDRAVQELHNFFNTIKSLHSLQLSEETELELKYDIGHKLRSTPTGLIDLGVRDRKLHSLIGDSWKLQQPVNYLTISDVNWCIRTEFIADEIEKLGLSVYRVKQTKTILFKDQYDIDSDADPNCLYTCLDYFLDDVVTENGPTKIPNDIFHISEDPKDATDTLSLSGFAIVGAVFVVVMLGIILFKARSAFRKRQ